MTECVGSRSRTLDVDIGNTRTKWRCGELTGVAVGIDAPSLPRRPRRVRIACVAAAVAEVTARFEDAYGVTPEFAKCARTLAGVTCGYENPAQLGVDRWLAAAAAWNAARRPLLVIDLGTAATLDFVAAGGRHLGGYIVPGLGLMAVALAQGTAGVRVAGDVGADIGPGANTAQAVRRGALAMLIDFIEASARRFAAQLGERPAAYLTGGDAALVAGRLALETRVAPDLVLDGLALALP